MDLLKLKLPPEVYECLINANVGPPSAIMAYSKTELADITMLDVDCVEQILKECAAVILRGKFGPAKCLKAWQHLSTGCSNIDAITRGGVPLNGISEISGYSGVGKTQICLQMALTIQMSGKSAVYIGTEDVFPVMRLKQLSEAFRERYQIDTAFEDNVFIQHAADGEQLKQCLFNRLPKLLSVRDIGLVVIDSIAGAFRSENQGVNYTNRSQEFVSLAAKLNKLAEKHHFAVICVNQVTENIIEGTVEPCLGLAWSNVITHRFNISRGLSSQVRRFEVVFAPDLPNKACKFMITEQGVVDVEQ